MKADFEYWIYRDGSVEYADGDIGDNDHDTIAIRWAQNEIYSLVGLNFESDTVFNEDEVEVACREEHGLSFKDYVAECDEGTLQGHPDTWWNDLYQIAQLEHPSPKEWAIEHLHWAWLRCDCIGVHSWDEETRTQLRRGLNNIYDEQGLDAKADEELWYLLRVYDGEKDLPKDLSVSLNSLKDKGLQPQKAFPSSVKSAQLENADKAMMPAIYAGKLGD